MKPNDFLIGWVYYDILRNRIDDKDVDNHKQEWIVEKNENDHMLRFQSNYRTEYTLPAIFHTMGML